MQRAHRHGQSREADDAVDNYIGGFDEIGKIVDNFSERQRRSDLRASRLIRDRHNLRTKLKGLAHKRVDGTPDAKCDNLIAIAFRAYNIECLLADGPGRTGDRDANSYLVTQGCR